MVGNKLPPFSQSAAISLNFESNTRAPWPRISEPSALGHIQRPLYPSPNGEFIRAAFDPTTCISAYGGLERLFSQLVAVEPSAEKSTVKPNCWSPQPRTSPLMGCVCIREMLNASRLPPAQIQSGPSLLLPR